MRALTLTQPWAAPESSAPAAPRFTAAELERAHENWGCNCGPAALAAVLGVTLSATCAPRS